MAKAQRVKHGTNVTSGWTLFVKNQKGTAGWTTYKRLHPTTANFITYCSQKWKGLSKTEEGQIEKERLNDEAADTTATAVGSRKRRVAERKASGEPRRPTPITDNDYFSGGSQDGGWDGFSDTSSTRSSDFTSVSDTTSFSASTDSSSMW